MKRIALGMAIGYVLGARAGEDRYKQITKAWDRILDSPTVSRVTGEGMAWANEAGRRAVTALSGRGLAEDDEESDQYEDDESDEYSEDGESSEYDDEDSDEYEGDDSDADESEIDLREAEPDEEDEDGDRRADEDAIDDEDAVDDEDEPRQRAERRSRSASQGERRERPSGSRGPQSGTSRKPRPQQQQQQRSSVSRVLSAAIARGRVD